MKLLSECIITFLATYGLSTIVLPLVLGINDSRLCTYAGISAMAFNIIVYFWLKRKTVASERLDDLSELE